MDVEQKTGGMVMDASRIRREHEAENIEQRSSKHASSKRKASFQFKRVAVTGRIVVVFLAELRR